MQKLSKDTLKSFRANITSILSPERLKSFEGDIESYYKNRLLALRAGHKIAEIEIYLRNMLDFCLRELVGEEWIREERSLQHIKPKTHLPLIELSLSQILSSLMLGEVIDLIGEYKIEHYMFELEDLDFSKYHWSNKNSGYLNGRKNRFSNVAKVCIALNLLRNIRNRAFHWENLLKIRKNNGVIYPRITHKAWGVKIGIPPEKILEFLDDLIDSIENEVIKSHQNIDIRGFKGGRRSALRK
ncbi:CAAX protease [Helicobacter brantae]|uniref:CAAX protease n=1 Tax=Helicobacter brantae TaxID=375927 RepID=A0A3D8IWD8_9HELI|nr:CAAX protease [Helicobacter brantae]RDU69343.1 CAAX protease [Helicobacter brantae]